MIGPTQDQNQLAQKQLHQQGGGLSRVPTEAGILPRADKLWDYSPPESVFELRQFLGLCNFFCTHVQNFTQISSTLIVFAKNESQWKGGSLKTPYKPSSTYEDIFVMNCLSTNPRKTAITIS